MMRMVKEGSLMHKLEQPIRQCPCKSHQRRDVEWKHFFMMMMKIYIDDDNDNINDDDDDDCCVSAAQGPNTASA